MDARDRIIRWALYLSLGVTGLAFWWPIDWINDACDSNPSRPDTFHSNLVVWYGGRAGTTRCYVSAADAHLFHLLILGLCAATAVTLALGLLRQRLPSVAA